MNKYVYELVSIENAERVPNKLYTRDQRESFIKDFQMLNSNGTPCMARGIGKDGKLHTECRNGFSEADVALTAKVNYGSGYNYTFIAGRHYDGQYSIITKRTDKNGNERNTSQIVAVKHEWRTLESLEYERAEKDIDFYKKFENVLIRKE